ncbi:MAG: lysophospholipid acyltransferase family protein [Planctomycetes bacterium]|nr:lysophospholipid acyltransferase family protein [Planctomycetota bacterium]
MEETKERSAVVDYLVYLAVRVVVCFLQALSFETAMQLASFLAWVVYKVDKRHREVATENLQKAFAGKLSDAEIDALVFAVYEHFCAVLIEIVHIPRKLHLQNYKKFARLHDPARMMEALLSGRPVLFVTGHFGNWEMAGYALGLLGFHSHAIARPLDNPHLDEYLRSFRERTGQKLLAKHGDFENIEKILSEGGVIATLADQDAGQRGLFVDFFGRPASTHKAVALLALEHNVPMVVFSAPKVAGTYRLWAIDVIYPEDYADSPDPVREITQRFTTGLEAMVRQAPEQYFWLHRRWKHAPPERRKKAKPVAA